MSEERNAGEAIIRGLKCKCPSCGKGALFSSYLKLVPQCAECGEDLTGHQADDMPPYLTIMLVGHIVVPLILFTEVNYTFPLWMTMTFYPLLVAALSLVCLPPLKGAVVGLQWAHRMHGFGVKKPTI